MSRVKNHDARPRGFVTFVAVERGCVTSKKNTWSDWAATPTRPSFHKMSRDGEEELAAAAVVVPVADEDDEDVPHGENGEHVLLVDLSAEQVPAAAAADTHAPLWRKVLKTLRAQWFFFALGLAVLLAYLAPWFGQRGGPLKPEYTVNYVFICIVFILTGLTMQYKAYVFPLFFFSEYAAV